MGTPWLCKYDPDGNELWTHEPGAGHPGAIRDCETDSADNVVAVDHLTQSDYDVAVFRYAP